MKLYHCAKSRGLRALWTIEEMGLPCDLVMLPFPPRRAVPDYLSFNPLGTVPVLVDDGVKLTESVGIAHYLATRYGPTELAVRVDEPDYGRFIDYLHHADATLTFPQTVFMRFGLFEQDRGLQEAGRLYAEWFVARLAKIDERLSNRSYLCEERFTVADIAVGYALFLARRLGFGDRLSPRLSDYLDLLVERPAFKRAGARERDTVAVTGPVGERHLSVRNGTA